ncbi:site-specific integrase [Pseudopedobacter beijingensis]|uniref:Site-specific integrase n=1 Tax=Pseudopedobacter beijingensis TaxID=1207056 RepID=A0ABW4IE31_9SPHI
MAKATLKLEQRRDTKTGQLKEKNIPVLIDFTFDGKRMWIQTGENVDRRNWDDKNKRVKPSAMNSSQINSYLQKRVEQINKIYREALLNDKSISVAYLRNKLNQVKTSSNKTFSEYYEEYIRNEELRCAKNTLKKHKTSFDLLKKFGTKKRVSIDFEIIDTEFFHNYVEFLREEMNHSNVTVSKYIRTLKQFLNYCSLKGYNKSPIYKTFSFSSQEAEIIALKKYEIQTIKNLDLSNEKCLDQVRDCFLFLCYTGLRYSDGANLRRENLNEGWIELISVKTKNKISVPLIPEAIEIINKYSNIDNRSRLLPFISNQKMNSYLKDIGKLANLNRDIIKVKYYGADRKEFPKKLHEVLTTHLGRKSFISYLFNEGMDSELIRSLSNHKSISSFARYNKIEDDLKKNQLLEKFKF